MLQVERATIIARGNPLSLAGPLPNNVSEFEASACCIRQRTKLSEVDPHSAVISRFPRPRLDFEHEKLRPSRTTALNRAQPFDIYHCRSRSEPHRGNVQSYVDVSFSGPLVSICSFLRHLLRFCSSHASSRRGYTSRTHHHRYENPIFPTTVIRDHSAKFKKRRRTLVPLAALWVKLGRVSASRTPRFKHRVTLRSLAGDLLCIAHTIQCDSPCGGSRRTLPMTRSCTTTTYIPSVERLVFAAHLCEEPLFNRHIIAPICTLTTVLTTYDYDYDYTSCTSHHLSSSPHWSVLRRRKLPQDLRPRLIQNSMSSLTQPPSIHPGSS